MLGPYSLITDLSLAGIPRVIGDGSDVMVHHRKSESELQYIIARLAKEKDVPFYLLHCLRGFNSRVIDQANRDYFVSVTRLYTSIYIYTV